jgi:hypothetical protein
MKKVLPYIFILLIITSFLAPFGVGVSMKGKVELKGNVASASCDKDNNPDGCDAKLYKTFTQEEKDIYDKLSVADKRRVNKRIYAGGVGDSVMNIFMDLGFTAGNNQASNAGSFTPEQQARYNTLTAAQRLIYESNFISTKNIDGSLDAALASRRSNDDGPGYFESLDCGLSHIFNCVIAGLLYPVFGLTSKLLELSGKLFDWAFNYSVQDTSYRSAFVVQGWGIVRDFVNMFFIFVLLYVAISTILGVHGFNTKSMIINVVIIGLLINFSLFATQVMIDTSNILARVFYNSGSILIKDINGNAAVGANGEVSLSAAIVNKFQPQKMLLSSETGRPPDLTVSSVFLILALMIGVNVVGIIVFLSTGLVFISRVIGLWLACIFVPFAFFSYTVPAMEGIEMVGWKHWWPDTLKMAFLAPVFIFFMYLILRFLSALDIFQASIKPDRTSFILGIMIPFIFIMMLLWKAKDIASDMSGTMGKAITSGIAAVGGLALGGAGLAVGLAGRQTLGAVSKYTQNNDARDKALSKEAIPKGWNKLNPIAWAGAGRNALQAGAAAGLHKSGLGAKMQEADNDFTHKKHAQHILEEKTQAVHGKDAKYGELTEASKGKIKEGIDKDAMAQFSFNRKFDKLDKPDRDLVEASYAGGGRPVVDHDGKVTKISTPVSTEKSSSEQLAYLNGKNSTAGEIVQALRKGTYDPRNLANAVASGSGFNKGAVAALALAASGIGLAMKKGVKIDYGVGQGDFLKDIGATITSALASVNIEAPKAPKESGGHDDHGGGHH